MDPLLPIIDLLNLGMCPGLAYFKFNLLASKQKCVLVYTIAGSVVFALQQSKRWDTLQHGCNTGGSTYYYFAWKIFCIQISGELGDFPWSINFNVLIPSFLRCCQGGPKDVDTINVHHVLESPPQSPSPLVCQSRQQKSQLQSPTSSSRTAASGLGVSCLQKRCRNCMSK